MKSLFKSIVIGLLSVVSLSVYADTNEKLEQVLSSYDAKDAMNLSRALIQEDSIKISWNSNNGSKNLIRLYAKYDNNGSICRSFMLIRNNELVTNNHIACEVDSDKWIIIYN